MGKHDSKAWAEQHLAKIKAELGEHFDPEAVLVDVLAAFDELMQVEMQVVKPYPPSAIVLDSPKSYARHKLETLPAPPKPEALAQGYIDNLETLNRAAMYNDLALLAAVRKGDRAQVALLCALCHDEEGNVRPVPLATMIDGDPYTMFYDPTEG